MHYTDQRQSYRVKKGERESQETEVRRKERGGSEGLVYNRDWMRDEPGPCQFDAEVTSEIDRAPIPPSSGILYPHLTSRAAPRIKFRHARPSRGGFLNCVGSADFLVGAARQQQRQRRRQQGRRRWRQGWRHGAGCGVVPVPPGRLGGFS